VTAEGRSFSFGRSETSGNSRADGAEGNHDFTLRWKAIAPACTLGFRGRHPSTLSHPALLWPGRALRTRAGPSFCLLAFGADVGMLLGTASVARLGFTPVTCPGRAIEAFFN
jgi:hypothetical protein